MVQTSQQRNDDPAASIGTLLIGWDGSEQARGAVRLGRLLAEVTGARIILASILVYELSPIGVEAYERFLAEDTRRLRAETGDELAGLEVESRVQGGGSPARAIQRLAEEEGVDLIVLGSSHRGPVGRVLLGSVAERVVHGAPCAVAVAPRDFAERPVTTLKDIGVGFDGSLGATAAVRFAASLALVAGATLHVLSVLEPFVFDAMGIHYREFLSLVEEDDPNAHARRLLKSRQAAVTGSLSDALQVETVLSEGDAVSELAGRSRDLDLLVLGSRGYGPIRRVLLGGATSKLLRSAASPVLVIPRSDD